MTLAALLEELKVVDASTWNYMIKWNVNMAVPETSPLSMFIIQGSIQRACERPDHQWPFHVAYYPPEGPTAPYYQAYIWPVLKCYTVQADTAAEALLAAYIAAVPAKLDRWAEVEG